MWVSDNDDLVLAVGQETDATPPVVAITSPAEGATLERVVTVTVEASDNFGVQRVELYDGATLIGTDSRAPYSVSWATRTVSNGPHTLTARAYDAAGNVSTSAPVQVLIDNDYVPPQVAFITPMDGATVSQTVLLEASASDDRGVTYVAFWVDDILIDSSAPPYTVSWNTREGSSKVSNGPHVLSVRAYDMGGNASFSSTVNVVVDNNYVLPQVVLTSPANGAALSGLVPLEATASDDQSVAEVSFYVDGVLIGSDTTAPYALSWDSTQVFSGGHSLSAMARDAVGNQKWSEGVSVQVSNPVSARYDSALRVPRCDGVAALCDSRTLVRGRARPSGYRGVREQNTPNTLDGCLDGMYGTDEYEETIHRLRVFREDGTPMATGKRVRIEVDVFASTYSFSMDKLDLYYTANATGAPAWTYLTTVLPTAKGAQTLSAEYVLPTGGLQAVRAVFGTYSILEPCAQGWPVTERDDLVFPVGPREADTVPPDEVVLTAPAAGATVTGTVPVTVSARDNLGVVAVDFLDGQTLLGTDTQPPYSVSWNSRNGPNGSRTLTARARDLAGNEVTSQPLTVTAHNDLSVPVVALTAPSDGAQLTASVTLTVNATDPEGVTRVEFYRNSMLLGSDSSAPFSYLWNTQNEYVGDYVLTARAYDAAGNVGTSAQVRVRYSPEFTPPSVSLTAPASGARISKTVTISANASDASGVSRVEFLLDGTVLERDYSAPYSYSWNTLSAAEGSHVLSVRAMDTYYNTATSTGVAVTVDNAGPAVVITSPASGSTVTGVVPLLAEATDGAGVAQVDFYVDGRLLVSDTTAPFGTDWDTRFFSNGTHTVNTRSRDGMNNEVWGTQMIVTTDQPGGAAYDSVLRVPKCATPDSVCDTTGLVKGRSAGEPYGGPNTLNAACADGSSYLGPQLTRIKLSSVDGERFAQGGRVQLEVYLNASSLADELDLFSTGNATSPSWTYLTTLKPGATGDQVLSMEYTLPMGGLQAVRARYRTGSSPKTACGTGGHDHDDVAFAVGVGPTVALTAPSSNAYVTGVVPLAAMATGSQGVARVDFYVDGTLLGTDTSAPYELSWDSTGVAEGAHSLNAKAYGTDGIPTTSPAVVVYIDSTPPDAAVLTSPVQGRVVGGNVLLEATASDNVGVARVEFHADGTLIGTDSTSPHATFWNTSGVGEGAHTLTVKAFDGAGNVRSSDGVWVTVDNTAPATAITAPARNALVGGSVQVTATASDTNGVAKVELYVDGTLIGTDTSEPYQVGWNTSGVVEGAHTLTLKAYDTAGNAATSSPVVVTLDSTLPDVALTSPGPGTYHRGTVELAATASDNQGVARVEFYVEAYNEDALLGTDSTAPYTLSWNTLATSTYNGANTLKVKAFDIAGNVRTSARVVVTIDNTAPTAGVSTPAYGAHVRGIVPFTAIARDSLGVERVEFYDNGTLLGTDFTEPYVVDWDTTLVLDGHHNLVAKVFDIAGNMRSSAQQPVAVDNSAPMTALSAPAQNAQVRGSVPVSATASDNLGVVKVEFFADGTLLGTLTTAPYVVGWNSTGVADGVHTLITQAYDKAGNVTTSAAVQVEVDNTLPDVALASPVPGTFLGGTAALEATASDSGSVARVDFYADGTLLGTDTSAPYTLSWSTAGVADGAHTLTVKATDGAGNARASAEVAVTVDNTAPVTALSAPAQNGSVRGTVPVSATASDAGGVERVEFYADGALLGTASVVPYGVSWDTTALSTGSTVTLTTRAYDLAGNVSVSASRTVTVDHTAPTVAITSPANGTSFSFLTFSTTLQASASDNRGVTQVVFYDGASVIGTDTTAPYSVSWSLGGVPKGTHTLTARAYDAAGNVTTSAPVSVKVN
ncbi:Ig-like domain-containing protein [Archangium sp.]|uniref:Ig-like domain-containing protein n=1 Tax=Archangium sp. TaxID=1872627 RepID=UPI002ED9AD48